LNPSIHALFQPFLPQNARQYWTLWQFLTLTGMLFSFALLMALRHQPNTMPRYALKL
jgi:hypothetical protein